MSARTWDPTCSSLRGLSADRDEFWDAFIGSAGAGGDPDLSAKAKEILRAEMGK